MTPNMHLVGVADRDLLGMVVGWQTATHLYQGSLSKLLSPSDHQHPVLAAAQELVMRSLVEQMQSRPVLSAPALVKDYLRLHFIGREYESFVVMYLDAQHRLMKADELFRGTITQTFVYPREVVKAALRENAVAVILAHNHPSGVAEPSRADERLTQALKTALALVDIQVLDHLVVAGPASVSFAERGLL